MKVTPMRISTSNVRILLVDILTFDGFFGTKFDILKPRWLRTTSKRKDRSTASKPSNGLCVVELGQNFCAYVACVGNSATEIEAEPVRAPRFTPHAAVPHHPHPDQWFCDAGRANVSFLGRPAPSRSRPKGFFAPPARQKNEKSRSADQSESACRLI